MNRVNEKNFRALHDWRKQSHKVEFFETSKPHYRTDYSEFFDSYPDVTYDCSKEPTFIRNQMINRFWFSDHRAAMDFKLRFG